MATTERTSGAERVRDVLGQLWGQSIEPPRELVTADASVTAPGCDAAFGPEGVHEAAQVLRRAFPDGTATVADVVAGDGLAVARIDFEGTHTGDLFGIPPTGRRTSVLAIVVASMTERGIASFQVEYDLLGLFERLGVLPSIETVPYAAIWTMSRVGRLRRERDDEQTFHVAQRDVPRDGEGALVHGVLDEVFNRRNLDAADLFLARDVVVHHPVHPGPVVGLDAFKDLPRKLLEGFPDLSATPELLVVDGDRVGTRWVIRGTHAGRYRRVPATGRAVTIPVQEIVRVRDGQIAEMWFAINLYAVAQQLGVMPSLTTLARLRRIRPRRPARSATLG